MWAAVGTVLRLGRVRRRGALDVSKSPRVNGAGCLQEWPQIIGAAGAFRRVGDRVSS